DLGQIHFVPGSRVSDWGSRVSLPVNVQMVATRGKRAQRARGAAPASVDHKPAPHAPIADNLGRLPTLAQPLPPPPTLKLRRPLPMSDVRDGINTVIVVMVDGHGQRQVAKQAFFASAPLVSKDEKREPKLPAGIRHVTGMPTRVESRALIVPRKER